MKDTGIFLKIISLFNDKPHSLVWATVVTLNIQEGPEAARNQDWQLRKEHQSLIFFFFVHPFVVLQLDFEERSTLSVLSMLTACR